MSNFVTDPNPYIPVKSDLVPLQIGENPLQWMAANDWNQYIRQPLYDIRSYILNMPAFYPASINFQQGGTPAGTSGTLNFAGSGVSSVVTVGSVTTVTISGGSSSPATTGAIGSVLLSTAPKNALTPQVPNINTTGQLYMIGNLTNPALGGSVNAILDTQAGFDSSGAGEILSIRVNGTEYGYIRFAGVGANAGLALCLNAPTANQSTSFNSSIYINQGNTISFSGYTWIGASNQQGLNAQGSRGETISFYSSAQTNNNVAFLFQATNIDPTQSTQAIMRIYDASTLVGTITGGGGHVLNGTTDTATMVPYGIYRDSSNTVWLISGTATALKDANYQKTLAQLSAYDMLFYFASVPTASQVIGSAMLPRAVTLPVNCAGSVGKATTPPTSTATVLVQKNGATVVTISIASGTGAVTFTNASPVSFSAGDMLTLLAQASPDATLAGINISLAGTY